MGDGSRGNWINRQTDGVEFGWLGAAATHPREPVCRTRPVAVGYGLAFNVSVASVKFRHSIENFRGLAILFVVVSHLLSLRAVGPLGDALYFAFGDATSWFVFVSGYLFYHTEIRRFDFGSYFRKKVRFVLAPYLVFATLAVAVGIYHSRPELLGLSLPAYVLWSLVVGGSVVAPLWFVPMITGFFLLSPLFIRLARDRGLYLATACGLAFSLFSGRPVANLNPVLAFFHFAGFYMLGLVVASRASSISAALKGARGWEIAALGLAVFLWSAVHYGGYDVSPEGFLDGLGQLNHMQLGKLGLLMAVYVVFEKLYNRENRLLGYLAKISFGVFFVHGFAVLAFAVVLRPRVFLSSEWMPMFEFGWVLGVSVLVVEMIKWTFKGRSRYVVGC